MTDSNRIPFPNEAMTKWVSSGDGCDRAMYLVSEFSYHDPDGKAWVVPGNSWINGATIPRSLWSIVGSPYCGSYRRASIVHDFYVGEGPNPDVDSQARRLADRMFYYACIDGGCSVHFAGLLYIAVRIGSWLSQLKDPQHVDSPDAKIEWARDRPDYTYIQTIFWSIADDAEMAIDKGELDRISEVIDLHLSNSILNPEG